MLSSTASPFKRQSVTIPQSMQKLIAKLQLPKKNRKSLKGPLSLEYSSLGKRKVNSSVRDVISPLKKSDDSTGNQCTNDSTKATPTRNKNLSRESVAKSPLMEYSTLKKRTSINSSPLIKDSGCTSMENTNVLPAPPHKNYDSISNNPLCSFEEDDETFRECPSDELITAGRSHMKKKLFHPQTSLPDEYNSATTEQRSTTDNELSRSHRFSENKKQTILASITKQKLGMSDKFFIASDCNVKKLTPTQVNVPDEYNSTTMDEKSMISQSHRLSKNTKKNTPTSIPGPKLGLKNTTTATTANKDDNAGDFITFNNLLQYSGRGSFANELFRDDDDEMDGYTPEFQDKSVQVPALKYDPEKRLRSKNDIHGELVALVQQVRGLNDMILKANERILNSSKLHHALGNGDA